MQNELLKNNRKSHIELCEIVFWTATIHKWIKLLEDDNYKDLILDSLNYLSEIKCIDVFGFVIMPNHIHLIWRINKLNGTELPHKSFLKHTAHKYKDLLKNEDVKKLSLFNVNASNKNFEFWQRDSLAIRIFSPEMALQKLNYIHNNPVTEHWQLAVEVFDYKYSSALFYEKEINTYSFLKDIRNEF
jgi:REP element-mobilizing transposase RayT